MDDWLNTVLASINDSDGNQLQNYRQTLMEQLSACDDIINTKSGLIKFDDLPPQFTKLNLSVSFVEALVDFLNGNTVVNTVFGYQYALKVMCHKVLQFHNSDETRSDVLRYMLRMSESILEFVASDYASRKAFAESAPHIANSLCLLLRDRTFVLTHDQLRRQCLELALSVLMFQMGEERSRLYGDVQSVLRFTTVDADCSAFSNYNMASVDLGPGRGLVLGLALVLCETDCDTAALEGALQQLRLVPSVHCKPSSAQLREIISVAREQVARWDLFVCVMVGRDGKFRCSDDRLVDLFVDVVKPVCRNLDGSVLNTAVNVFLSNLPLCVPDNDLSDVTHCRALVAHPLESHAAVSSDLLLRSFVAAVEQHRDTLQLHDVLRATKLSVRHELNSSGSRDSEGSQQAGFTVTTFGECHSAKIVVTPNVSGDVLQWLLHGVVFGCKDCADLCLYVSRFARMLFLGGVEDFHSLMALRSQYENVEDLKHEVDAELLTEHAYILLDLLHGVEFVASAFGCRVAVRHTYDLHCAQKSHSPGSGSVKSGSSALGRGEHVVSVLRRLALCLTQFLRDASVPVREKMAFALCEGVALHVAGCVGLADETTPVEVVEALAVVMDWMQEQQPSDENVDWTAVTARLQQLCSVERLAAHSAAESALASEYHSESESASVSRCSSVTGDSTEEEQEEDVDMCIPSTQAEPRHSQLLDEEDEMRRSGVLSVVSCAKDLSPDDLFGTARSNRPSQQLQPPGTPPTQVVTGADTQATQNTEQVLHWSGNTPISAPLLRLNGNSRSAAAQLNVYDTLSSTCPTQLSPSAASMLNSSSSRTSDTRIASHHAHSAGVASQQRSLLGIAEELGEENQQQEEQEELTQHDDEMDVVVAEGEEEGGMSALPDQLQQEEEEEVDMEVEHSPASPHESVSADWDDRDRSHSKQVAAAGSDSPAVTADEPTQLTSPERVHIHQSPALSVTVQQHIGLGAPQPLLSFASELGTKGSEDSGSFQLLGSYPLGPAEHHNDHSSEGSGDDGGSGSESDSEDVLLRMKTGRAKRPAASTVSEAAQPVSRLIEGHTFTRQSEKPASPLSKEEDDGWLVKRRSAVVASVVPLLQTTSPLQNLNIVGGVPVSLSEQQVSDVARDTTASPSAAITTATLETTAAPLAEEVWVEEPRSPEESASSVSSVQVQQELSRIAAEVLGPAVERDVRKMHPEDLAALRAAVDSRCALLLAVQRLLARADSANETAGESSGKATTEVSVPTLVASVSSSPERRAITAEELSLAPEMSSHPLPPPPAAAEADEVAAESGGEGVTRADSLLAQFLSEDVGATGEGVVGSSGSHQHTTFSTMQSPAAKSATHRATVTAATGTAIESQSFLSPRKLKRKFAGSNTSSPVKQPHPAGTAGLFELDPSQNLLDLEEAAERSEVLVSKKDHKKGTGDLDPSLSPVWVSSGAKGDASSAAIGGVGGSAGRKEHSSRKGVAVSFALPVADTHIETRNSPAAPPPPLGVQEEAEFDESLDKSDMKRQTTHFQDSTPSKGGLDGALPACIPAHYAESGLPDKWSEVWAGLEAVGWTWTKGKGLVDFYYLRPECGKAVPPHTMGIDYFGSTEEVLKFVRAEIEKCFGFAPVAAVPGSGGKSGGLLKPNKNKARISDEEEEEVAFTYDSDQQDEAPHCSSAATGNSLVKPQTTPVTEVNVAVKSEPSPLDIRTIPWRDLWSLLRNVKGWTWDFGSGNVRSVYFVPGFDKRNKAAVLNVHKFESEEAVRRFVRKQKWPEFGGDGVSAETNNAQETAVPPDALPIAESQVEDSQQLLLHSGGRRRRKAASGGVSSKYGVEFWVGGAAADGEEEEDEEVSMQQQKVTRNTSPSFGISGELKQELVRRASSSDLRHTEPVQQAGRSNSVIKSNSNINVSVSSSGSGKLTAQRSAPPDLSAAAEEEFTQAQQMNMSPISPVLRSRENLLGRANSVNSSHKSSSKDLVSSAKRNVEIDGAYTAGTCELGSARRDRRGASSATKAAASSPSKVSVKVVSMLFAGLTFVVSGFDEKDEVILEIRRNGGAVLDAVPLDANRLVSPHNADPFARLVLVSHPKEFRKLNYLLALATGCHLVHFKWVRDCLHSRHLQPLESYNLSSGSSAIHPCYVFQNSFPPPERGFFAAVRVLNLAGSVWDKVLQACGAVLVRRESSVLQALLVGDAQPSRHEVDWVLVDPLEYAASVVGSSSSKSARRSENAGVVSGLSALELKLIAAYTERPGAGPKVVSTDWVVHCLVLAVPDLSTCEVDIFSLPTDPARVLYAHKSEQGERYSKYDVVYYSRGGGSAASELSVGKIVKLSRRSVDTPLQVKIKPLHFVNSGGNGSKKNQRGTDFSDRELTCDPGDKELLVDAQRLAGKAVILPREAFVALQAYAASDPDIYFASQEWIDGSTYERGPQPVQEPLLSQQSGNSEEESRGGKLPANKRIRRSQDY